MKVGGQSSMVARGWNRESLCFFAGGWMKVDEWGREFPFTLMDEGGRKLRWSALMEEVATLFSLSCPIYFLTISQLSTLLNLIISVSIAENSSELDLSLESIQILIQGSRSWLMAWSTLLWVGWIKSWLMTQILLDLTWSIHINSD